MTNIKDSLKPTKMKIILTLALLVPIAFLSSISLMIISFSLYGSGNLILFSIITGVLISYLISALIDNSTKNRTAKIIIASASGLISIIILYIIYKTLTEAIVCDPVHLSTRCEIKCEDIFKNSSTVTNEAQQKFTECMQRCR